MGEREEGAEQPTTRELRGRPEAGRGPSERDAREATSGSASDRRAVSEASREPRPEGGTTREPRGTTIGSAA